MGEPRETRTTKSPDRSPIDSYEDERTARHFATERFRGRGARETAIVEELLKTYGEPGPLLDVACGALRFLPVWSRGDYSPIVAGDRAHAMLRQSRTTGPLGGRDSKRHPRVADGTADVDEGRPASLVQLDAYRLPFADRSFPNLVCLRLLHHFPTPGEVQGILSELGRVSRGIVLTSYFDSRSFQHLRRRVKNRISRKTSHRYSFSRTAFLESVCKSGLQVVAIRPVARLIAEQCVVVLATPKTAPVDTEKNPDV